MRHLPSPATLLLLAVAATGCGSGSDGGQEPPPPPELTTVEVTPPAATIFTLQPANRIRLTATGKDQDGAVIRDLPDPTFSSDDEGVGTVDADGVVTAVAPGTARITASITLENTPKTGTAEITVAVASEAADVVAPQFQFQPQVVDVAAGGDVTWNVGAVHHTVDFTTSGAPDDIPEMLNQSVSRSFPSPGTFEYHCTLHNGMTGTVRVH